MSEANVQAALQERVERYLGLTEKALQRVRPTPPSRSFLSGGAQDFLSMARNYLQDARHFQKEGDWIRSLAAVSYAHAWLDAGVRLGLLDGGDDDQTFTQFR